MTTHTITVHCDYCRDQIHSGNTPFNWKNKRHWFHGEVNDREIDICNKCFGILCGCMSLNLDQHGVDLGNAKREAPAPQYPSNDELRKLFGP